jgi:hypothetical protein
VSLIAGDRVLLKNQASTSDKGIWVVAAGAWTRAADLNQSIKAPGAFVFVEEGTVNHDTGWVCTADSTFAININDMPWTQFSGAGEYTWGGGLLATGSTVDVGAGAGIQVNADTIQVANNGITNAMIADGAINLASADVTGTLPITQGGTGGTTAGAARAALGGAGYYNNSATHGAGTSIVITAATHGLRASRGLIVQSQDNATGVVDLPDIAVAASGDVTITYAVSVGANSKLITIIG